MNYLYSSIPPEKLAPEEEEIINHVKNSIVNGFKRKSNLNKPVLDIHGMSSAKVRHFLNNLCSLQDASYLEVGTWKGSTFIASLFNNGSIKQAIAIDNWSKFGGPYEEFLHNCSSFLGSQKYQAYFEDCFTVDKSSFLPVNIYFYDGDHSEDSQEKAFTYFDSVFSKVFIAVVDDWEWDRVRKGTFSAFTKLNYRVLFETRLAADHNCDLNQWWNGLYVSVISKK